RRACPPTTPRRWCVRSIIFSTTRPAAAAPPWPRRSGSSTSATVPRSPKRCSTCTPRSMRSRIRDPDFRAEERSVGQEGGTRRWNRDWSSDVCSSALAKSVPADDTEALVREINHLLDDPAGRGSSAVAAKKRVIDVSNGAAISETLLDLYAEVDAVSDS